MKIFYLLGAIASAIIFCTRVVAVGLDVIGDFGDTCRRVTADVVYTVYDICRAIIMAPFRLDYGAAREFIDRYVFALMRIIGLLKPEYQESLETDAQSHLSALRLARHC